MIFTEETYYVGPGEAWESLTGLLLHLDGDDRRKTVYLRPGTYDIFAEYKEAGVQPPPEDVPVGDYFDYNAFLPPNTSLIGLGNVTLMWHPASSVITRAESRTWSPLNVLGSCVVENITIICVNGRYCIHDDDHNKLPGSTHIYRNVRCFRGENDEGLGFGSVIGFGFSDLSRYIFEDCTFATGAPGNVAAFYGHGCGRRAAINPDLSPSITVRDCIIKSDAAGNCAVRLQTLSDGSQRIITDFKNCFIQGGLHLHAYREAAGQSFDVTLLHSGNPPITCDNAADNTYPVKIYE